MPLEKIVLETDCPFLKLKGISEITTAEIIYQNTIKLFGLSNIIS